MQSLRLVCVAAILVGATSTTVYYKSFTSSTTCESTAVTNVFAMALDTCSCYAGSAGGTCVSYQKMTLVGTTYTWTLYDNADCSTASGSTTSGAVDVCVVQGTNGAKHSATCQAGSGTGAVSLSCTATACSALTCSSSSSKAIELGPLIGIVLGASVVVIVAICLWHCNSKPENTQTPTQRSTNSVDITDSRESMDVASAAEEIDEPSHAKVNTRCNPPRKTMDIMVQPEPEMESPHSVINTITSSRESMDHPIDVSNDSLNRADSVVNDLAGGRQSIDAPISSEPQGPEDGKLTNQL